VNTTNPTLRKQWVDETQRVFYNDSPYIILSYGYQTYAWRNDTFTGWGDWQADPGRSVDNFWMGNPLWFDLVPAGPPPDGNGGGILVYVIAGAVIAAVILAVVYLVMRGKKKEGSIRDKSPLGE